MYRAYYSSSTCSIHAASVQIHNLSRTEQVNLLFELMRITGVTSALSPQGILEVEHAVAYHMDKRLMPFTAGEIE